MLSHGTAIRDGRRQAHRWLRLTDCLAMDTRRHRLENGLLLGTAVSQHIPPGYFISILAVSPGEPE